MTRPAQTENAQSSSRVVRVFGRHLHQRERVMLACERSGCRCAAASSSCSLFDRFMRAGTGFWLRSFFALETTRMVVGKLRRAVLALAGAPAVAPTSHESSIPHCLMPEISRSRSATARSAGLSCSSSVRAIFTSEHRAAARVKSGRWSDATVWCFRASGALCAL